MAAGDRLTAPVGLTAARWQVLSTIARAERPETVANIGRIMGLSRQGVQRIVNELTSDALLRPEANPHHKRATLICLTEKGRKTFEAITARQVPWVNALSEHLPVEGIDAALHVLASLTRLLNDPEMTLATLMAGIVPSPDANVRARGK